MPSTRASAGSFAIALLAIAGLAACSAPSVPVPEPIVAQDGAPTLVIDGQQVADAVSCTIVDLDDRPGVGALVSTDDGSFTATLESRDGETVVTAVLYESDAGDHILSDDTRAGSIAGETVSFEVVVPGREGTQPVGVAFAGECMRL